MQTFGPPPCILIARTVATRTTQSGMRPRFGENIEDLFIHLSKFAKPKRTTVSALDVEEFFHSNVCSKTSFCDYNGEVFSLYFSINSPRSE
jgi:hypothetical protein